LVTLTYQLAVPYEAAKTFAIPLRFAPNISVNI
jgi:hypothetical protein